MNKTLAMSLCVALVAAQLLRPAWSGPLGEAFTSPSQMEVGEVTNDIHLPFSSFQTFLAPARIADVLGNVAPDNELATRSGIGASIYRAVSPSVVLIVTDQSLGSGALLSEDGLIVTNWHVIEGATRVGVIFKPDQEGGVLRDVDVRRARVQKIDEVVDLALLQVDSAPVGRFPLSLGRLEDVSIGADVHAIGHPSGESWTYTRGFVSQIRRSYQWHTESGVQHLADVIQTQTPINPGNSGGPLLDETGQLIGINSFKAEGEALNFAVSVDEVRAFLERPQGRQAARVPVTPTASPSCDEAIFMSNERRVMASVPGELFWVDVDCDGEADFQMFIPDDEAEPISVLADTTGDGRIDTIFLDMNRNGEVDLSLVDTNGDGSADLQGFHRNGEFEPYRVKRLN
jgi:S1-C subfamily serine protease